jgi:hypothetical protein
LDYPSIHCTIPKTTHPSIGPSTHPSMGPSITPLDHPLDHPLDDWTMHLRWQQQKQKKLTVCLPSLHWTIHWTTLWTIERFVDWTMHGSNRNKRSSQFAVTVTPQRQSPIHPEDHPLDYPSILPLDLLAVLWTIYRTILSTIHWTIGRLDDITPRVLSDRSRRLSIRMSKHYGRQRQWTIHPSIGPSIPAIAGTVSCPATIFSRQGTSVLALPRLGNRPNLSCQPFGVYELLQSNGVSWCIHRTASNRERIPSD